MAVLFAKPMSICVRHIDGEKLIIHIGTYRFAAAYACLSNARDEWAALAIACYQYGGGCCWMAGGGRWWRPRTHDLSGRRDFLAEMHIRRMPEEAMCG